MPRILAKFTVKWNLINQITGNITGSKDIVQIVAGVFGDYGLELSQFDFSPDARQYAALTPIQKEAPPGGSSL